MNDLDVFYDVSIAFARQGFRKPPNMEVELQLFLAACGRARESNPESCHGRAVRVYLRPSMGSWVAAGALEASTMKTEEVWVTEAMVKDGVRFAAPQGYMLIRTFEYERAKLLATIEKFGMVI